MTVMSCEFESHFLHLYIAEIAQLVEHNLAKVRVASSSLVFRSKEHNYITAEIAQLVEHNLAKVRVASSSLVFRSTMRESMISWFPFFMFLFQNHCFGSGV